MGGRRRAALTATAAFVLLFAATSASAQTEIHDGPPQCGVAADTGAPGADDGVLRVATYNILHTQGSYDDETIDRRIDLVVEALAASDADIVGMQEVVASANHGLVAERVALGLEQATGDDWAWCFFRSNPHLPGEADAGPGGIGGPVSQAIADVARSGDSPWSEGVAILSRFPIADAAAHRLAPRLAEAPVCQVENPENPLAIPTCAVDTRQVMWAAVTSPCGTVDMFSTHLANDESSASETSRQLQAVDALAAIESRTTDGPAPDVFVGDFNTLEGGPVWQAVIDAGFVDGFRQAEPDDPGLTSGQDIDVAESTVSRRIDYVFVRPGTEPPQLTDGAVIGDAPVPFSGSDGQTVVWPSDHYGVAVSTLTGTACGVAPMPEAGDVGVVADSGTTATTEPGSPSLPATGRSTPVVVLAVVVVALAVLRMRTARPSA